MIKSIASTNKYLKNPINRAMLVRRTATTSTAIEGVHMDQHKKRPRLTKQKMASHKA